MRAQEEEEAGVIEGQRSGDPVPPERRSLLVAGFSSDVVYETDKQGVIRWITPSVLSVLGFAPDTLVGTQARQLVHPDDLQMVNALRAQVYGGAEVPEMTTTRFRTAAGSYRTMSVRAHPLMDESGSVTGAVVAVRDTHEVNAALRALTTLSKANGVMVRATDEQTLLQSMCQTVTEAGGYAFAWYGRRVDDVNQSVLPVAWAEEHKHYLDSIEVSWGEGPLGLGPTGMSIRTRTTQVRNNLGADPRYSPWVQAAGAYGFSCSISMPVIVDGEVDGALMVYSKLPGTFDHDAQLLMEDLAADLGYGLARLRDARRLALALRNSITMLSAAVESRDPYTAGHQGQVAKIASAIGLEMGLDEDLVEGLAMGSSVHDIGKIAVPHAILNKPGRPTAEEWAVLRSHPQVGRDIAGEFPWPWPIAEMIYQHHERMDGSGYPRGLVGEQILLEARIIAVADTVDAIAHDRPYRKAPGLQVAFEVIRQGRGTLFDAEVVDAFFGVVRSGFVFPIAVD